MKGNPHAVQIAALDASAGHRGFAWFMEQGLGKTLTSYMEFERSGLSRKVVVCPNSFKQGWVEDAEKWGVEVDCFVWEAGRGPDFVRWCAKGWKMPPVLIINYEAIRAADVQSMIINFALGARSGAMLAFDESIQLKNNTSLQTKAAMGLESYFALVRLLSGKPITQGPHDLWGQMRAMGHLKGKNYYAFKTAFCRMGGFKMKQVIGAQNEDYLAQLIDPHVFRATKAEWTDLPPKIYTQREYKLSPDMKRMFDSMYNDFVLYLEDDVVTVDVAITKYIKLAQIQAGFIIDEGGKVHELVPPDKNPRVNLLMEILENEVVGKTLIPYHHKYTFEILNKALIEYKPAFIRGSMEPSEIERQKARFNNDDDCRVILLQTRASKYGHTLLGSPTPLNRAETMIFFENTYSLDDRSQIEDRMHRHGQTADSVLYIDLWGTIIDRDATRALQRKEGVFQSVFSKLRRTGRPALQA